jgi:hypothetical protein
MENLFQSDEPIELYENVNLFAVVLVVVAPRCDRLARRGRFSTCVHSNIDFHPVGFRRLKRQFVVSGWSVPVGQSGPLIWPSGVPKQGETKGETAKHVVSGLSLLYVVA